MPSDSPQGEISSSLSFFLLWGVSCRPQREGRDMPRRAWEIDDDDDDDDDDEHDLPSTSASASLHPASSAMSHKACQRRCNQ